MKHGEGESGCEDARQFDSTYLIFQHYFKTLWEFSRPTKCDPRGKTQAISNSEFSFAAPTRFNLMFSKSNPKLFP